MGLRTVLRHAILAVTAAALAACSSTPDAAPTSLIDVSSASPTVSTSAATSTSTSAASDAPSASDPTPTAATPTATLPWPEGLSPADQTRAQAGIDVFNGFYSVVNSVYIDPAAKDWSVDINRYATGDAEASLLADVQTYRQDGTHQVGSYTVSDVRVDVVAADQLTVSGCVGGDVQYLDAAGSVTLHLTDSARQTATVVTRDGGAQRVTTIVDPQAAPSC